MLPLNYTAGSRKPIAIPVDLKPHHRGSDTAHMRRTARCPSRQLRRTAEMNGYPPLAGACADGKVAPKPDDHSWVNASLLSGLKGPFLVNAVGGAGRSK